MSVEIKPGQIWRRYRGLHVCPCAMTVEKVDSMVIRLVPSGSCSMHVAGDTESVDKGDFLQCFTLVGEVLRVPEGEISRDPMVKRALELGQLVTEKQRQYGDAAAKSAAIMRALYPSGIAPHQMGDALLTVRVLDKLSRIAQRGPDGKDLGGESPWKDISGYGLLGWAKDEPEKINLYIHHDPDSREAHRAGCAKTPSAATHMITGTRWEFSKMLGADKDTIRCCGECLPEGLP